MVSAAAETENHSQNTRRPPFGLLAYIGAGTSLIFCYAQVLISLLAPLLGFAVFEMNIHVQAVCMWGFALVTALGLARDFRRHRSPLPLALCAGATLTIMGTLYIYYDVRILIIGYVLLVFSALANQNRILSRLNDQVAEKARELSHLNQTLSERVETQVAEIDRLARLKRFLSPEVADLVSSEGNEDLLNSHRRLIACLFCDIRSFTAFSDRFEPEEVMDVLQTYHESFGTLIADHKGTIGYRAGDGLMVVFNDPLPCRDPMMEVARLALDMRAHFATLNAQWHKLGYELGLGIGITSGYATLGLIGAEGRFDYTAIGNVVNVAARLCETAKDGQILINQRAHAEIEDRARFEPVGNLDLKGVNEKIETYNLIDLSVDGSKQG